MPTESLLRQVSRHLCSTQAWDLVIEPLLADLAFDLGRARTRFQRIAVFMRWTPAVGQALLLCGFRSGVTRLVALLSDRDRVLIWSYSIGILLVVGIGPSWVRTGEVSVMSTLRGLSRAVPFMAWPIFVWGSMHGAPPPTGARGVRRAIGRVVVMLALLGATWWVNPPYAPDIAKMTAVNLLLIVFGRRYFARSWESVPEGRRIGEMGDHPSIKG